jgi:CheY-like chemotaxis protein
MASHDKVYRRTQAGRAAIESGDVAIPRDYRSILRLLETEAHGNVVRGNLRHFPDALLDEWLAELEELGLLESRPAANEQGRPLAAGGAGSATRPLAEDAPRIERETRAAGNALSRRGAYLAEDRLQNRAPLGKPPADTEVLVVEDDPDQLALADLRVSMAGYRVRVAESEQALLEALNTGGVPDILLLDVVLPDADGFEILAGIRRHPKVSLLPVVMLTAKDDAADIRRGLALGADGYITKPYSKNILADTIRRVLKTAAPA